MWARKVPERGKTVAYNGHAFKRLMILNIITHLGPISRTELIDLTDYRPATISDLIKELLDEELDNI